MWWQQLGTIAAIILLAGGCTLLQPKEPEPPPEPAPAPAAPEPVVPIPAPPPEESLSHSEYVARGIQRLQIGEAAQAREDFNKALALRPTSQRARKMLRQLDADPQTYLGGESFEYSVQVGDSLSMIAHRFLGDSLEFYILARYNNLTNPSRLAAGQTIRVPSRGTQPNRPVEAAPSFAEPTIDQPTTAEPLPPLVTVDPVSQPDPYPQARSLYDAGDYAGAINLLEGRSGDIRARELLAASYGAESERLSAQGLTGDARKMLQRANELDPGNATITQQLAALEVRREAQRLNEQGLAELQAGALEPAYRSFSQALAKDPSNSSASNGLATTSARLIQNYHKEASVLYRQQRLDEAISLWDRVLELDPNNEIAALYRTRAVDLQKRLKSL